MKHLFFVTVAIGIFSATTISVQAQANVNIERFASRAQPKTSPKFIEGIEMKPQPTANIITVPEEETKLAQLTDIKPVIVKNGFTGNIEACSPLQFKYAVMMDREVESISNFSLYNFIDEWWATRYQFGGTGRSGIDCSAFTGKLLSTVYGLTVPRMAKDQYKICKKIGLKDLQEGDLVFFNTRGGVSHVGLYLGNNYFTHSSVRSGVTISSLSEEYYSRKFISGGRPSSPLHSGEALEETAF
jgi:NlpC/P60 family